ncbi:MAG: glycosyltransferase [Anaerovoracaceae bacterium]
MTTKVCHVTSAHNTDDIRILKKECVSLAKNTSYDVYLVGKGESWEYKGVNIIGVGDTPVSRIKRIAGFAKKVIDKAIQIDADIYHLHDPELLMYVKKLSKFGKKVVFDSHEYYYEQILEKKYIPKFARKIIAGIYSIIENAACKYLDAAIFPCPVNGKHIFEGRVSKCVFINNLPMLEEFDSNCYGKNKKKSDQFKVCCIGSLTKERGIENLIDACYRSNVELILGGEFSPDDFKLEVQKKREYSIVDYRGYCSREEVMKIYQIADIGASTILSVGQYDKLSNLPTKVYEYMMASMPFIISNFDYNKHIIDKYHCGLLVDPNDVNSISNAIDYLITNYDEAIKMGENGRKAVEQEFNWENEERKLYSLYKEIIENT